MTFENGGNNPTFDSVKTDELQYGGGLRVKEDGNSPHTASNVASTTFTLSQTYAFVDVHIFDYTASVACTLQFNGDTNPNYEYLTISGSKTSNATDTGETINNQGGTGTKIRITGREDDNRLAFNVNPQTQYDWTVTGKKNKSQNLSSITFKTVDGSQMDITGRVVGWSE